MGMSELIIVIVTFVVGLAAGLFFGFAVGERLSGKSTWAFWLTNAFVLLAGVAGGTFAGAYQWSWLWGFSMVLIGGGLTGLKYGYGKSVGVWRVFDKVMGLDSADRD